MQTPTKVTPVGKCLELASYTSRMLGKFTDNPSLLGLMTKMQASGAALDGAQNAYSRAVKDILPARVDVKYENYSSDRRIRLLRQKIEIADGRARGRIATLVLPNGSSSIIRLVGASQIAAMHDLEGRLEASAPVYPEAMAEKAAIEEHRLRYQAALDHRAAAGRRARDLRAVRDATKSRFLLDYAQIAALVKAEFPRDRMMQDLFFDKVRSKSTATETDQELGDSEDISAASPSASSE